MRALLSRSVGIFAIGALWLLACTPPGLRVPAGGVGQRPEGLLLSPLVPGNSDHLEWRVTRLLAREARHLSARARSAIGSQVVRSALAFGLDPALLLALMRVESDFRPGAVSSRGAVGLLQVRPRTARWYTNRFGRPGDAWELARVRPNIRVGAGYLAYLLRRFDRWELGLHAYHRGPRGALALSSSPERLRGGYARRVISMWGRYHAMIAADEIDGPR